MKGKSIRYGVKRRVEIESRYESSERMLVWKGVGMKNTLFPNSKILLMYPVLNEEKKIGSAIQRVPEGYVDEILVVDDDSSDNTRGVCSQLGAIVLKNEVQSGVGRCIRRAIQHGWEKGFDVLVIMAGNNKDEPKEIPVLLDPILNHGFDFVQGSRYLKGGRYGNMPFYRILASRFIHPWLFSLISGKYITDSTNGFRAIKLSSVKQAEIDLDQPWLNHYELEPYLFYKMIRLGFKVCEAPVTKIYPPKELGYTKMKPITGWWNILKPLIYLGLRIWR